MLKHFLSISKYLLGVLIVIAVAALTAIHTLIDEVIVEKHLKSTATSLFGVTLEMDGKIAIDRLPALSIRVPATRFVKTGKDDKDKEILASFDAAHFEVALWSLPLGAKQINEAHIDGLKTQTKLSHLNGDAIFGETFASVRFPTDLRIQKLKLSNASLDLVYGQQQRLFQIRKLDMALGKVAPEMKSEFEVRLGLKSNNTLTDTNTAKEFSRYLPITIDTNHIDSEISLKGVMAISTNRRYVMLDDLRAAAEFNEPNNHYTVALRADRLRLHKDHFSGMNIGATLSQPMKINGDVQLAAVDFKYTPKSFISPEMRVSYKETIDNCTSAYDASGAVNADFDGHKAVLDNIQATVAITGGKALPDDFKSSFSGNLIINTISKSAEGNVSGNLTSVPFSYQGTIADLDNPQLRGSLSVPSLDVLNMPALKTLAVLSAIDYEGNVNIGRIHGNAFAGTQLKGNLKVSQGKATLSKAAVNVAGGMIHLDADLMQNRQWQCSGQYNGINLDTLFSVGKTASALTGSATGKFMLAGTSLSAQSLLGQANMTLRNGQIRYIDSHAVHQNVASGKTQQAVAGDKLTTSIQEAQANLALQGTNLTINNVNALLGADRASGMFTVDLANSTINGTTHITYAPVSGIPSIRMDARVEGPAASPVWHFDWGESVKKLARAQEVPTITPRKKNSDILKKVKEFFRF